MKFDFNQEVKKYEKDAGMGGNSFKFKEGQNKMRIVSPSVRYTSAYKGNVSTKFLTYILDRTDSEIKLAYLPFTVFKMIGDLQSNPEYAFDEVPMPYDITINATNAGKKEVEYSITPSRNNSPVTAEEKIKISQLKDLDKIKESLLKKQNNTSDDFSQPPVHEEEVIDTSTIPF